MDIKNSSSDENNDPDLKQKLRALLEKYYPKLIIYGFAALIVLVLIINGLIHSSGKKSVVYYDGEEKSSVDESSRASQTENADETKTTESAAVTVTTSKKSTQAAGSHPATEAGITVDTPETTEPVEFPIDINQATMEQLMLVNGIGEKTAQNIISYREQHGVITSIEQLAEISGIGEATVALLSQYFYVSDDVYVPYQTQTETFAPQTDSPQEETYETPTETTAAETSVETSDTTTQEVKRSPVDINHADAREISEKLLLPIEKAEDIIALRDQIQYFSNVAELFLVESLTQEEISAITDYVVILPL